MQPRDGLLLVREESGSTRPLQVLQQVIHLLPPDALLLVSLDNTIYENDMESRPLNFHALLQRL